MKQLLLPQHSIWAFLLASWIVALPDGSPECPQGRAAVGGPHLESVVKNGALSEGNIVVSFDGVVLQEGRILNLELEREYNVTIRRTSGTFRGLLWRIAGGDFNSDTLIAVTTYDDDDVLKVSPACLTQGVGGVSHANGTKNEVSAVSFALTLDLLDLSMPIDVTVVVSDSPSEYYYSQLRVNANLPSQSTSSPLQTPTLAPTPSITSPLNLSITNETEMPTLMPTSTSDSPSMIPSTYAPTTRPTHSSMPSFAPSPSPSFTPTSQPTSTEPTLAPTESSLLTIYQYLVEENFLLVDYIDLLREGFRPIIDNKAATWTFFAPNNEAFQSLHPRLVSWLTSDNYALVLALMGHTVDGALTLADLRPGEYLTFLNGQERSVSVLSNTTISIDGVQIVQADIPARNGYIHTINRILTIPTVGEYLVDENPTFLSQLSSTNLLQRMAAGSTLFSPRPKAFAEFSRAYTSLSGVIFSETVFELHKYELLAHHVASGMFFRSDFRHEQSLRMFSGELLSLSLDGQNATLSTVEGLEVASVVEFDGVTLEAVVHEVDKMLTPSFLEKTLADIITERTPQFSSLMVLVELDMTVRSVFGLTVLAPSQDAFDALDEEYLAFLQSDEGRVHLESILSYHILLRVLPTTTLEVGDEMMIPTFYQDEELLIRNDGANITINNDVATVVQADILGNNGIVHLIDKLISIPGLSPPSKSPTTASPSSKILPTMPTIYNSTEIPSASPSYLPTVEPTANINNTNGATNIMGQPSDSTNEPENPSSAVLTKLLWSKGLILFVWYTLF